MTQDTEQYRAGFEAWFPTVHECRDTRLLFERVSDDRRYCSMEVEYAWQTWLKCKREASTEPSAWMCPNSFDPEFTVDALLAGYWMRKGRTVTPLYAGAGALSDDAKDAARWRAFVGSARIKPQGSAGLNAPMAGNYAHMGLEIWTTFDGECSQKLLDQMGASTALGREWLKKYADIAVAAIDAHKAGRSDAT